MELDFIATFLLVPPVNLLLITIVGFILTSWYPRTGRWVSGIGLFGLLIFAMPLISRNLLVQLENTQPRTPPIQPTAIVILGGDVREIGGATPHLGVGPLTLERLRAGAAVYRSTHLPIVTTGGTVNEGDLAIAALMSESLMQDFGTPTRWVEKASRTTWENAERSAVILKAENISSIYLVTHAWHMRRAMIAFAHFGIAVTPAPVPPDETPWFGWEGLLPEAAAWLRSYYAMHEWIGCAWYALRASLT